MDFDELLNDGLSWPEAFLFSVIAVCILAVIWLILRSFD